MLEDNKPKRRLLEDNFDITPLGLEFCFNREIFLNEEFDVDQFVVDHKKRVPLENLRGDLLQYFNILKSSLIELINQDYADFVNLSTNLVGLDKAIKTIETPLEQIRSEIKIVQDRIDATVKEIEEKLKAKQSIREKKNLLHVIRCTDLSIARLEKLLCVPPSDDTARNLFDDDNAGQVLERVGIEFSKLQFFNKKSQEHPITEKLKPRILTITQALQLQLESYLCRSIQSVDRKGVRQALRTYLAIDRIDIAELVYSENFVRPKLTEIFSERRLQSESLSDLYNEALVFLDEDYQQMKQHMSHHGRGFEPLKEFDFVVNSFWTELVRILLENLSCIFAPGNPDLFHQRYIQSLEFLDNVESRCDSIDHVNRLRNHPSYSEFLNKWSLPVYFQIRFQDIASKIEAEASKGLINTSNAERGELLTMTATTIDQLERCWQDGIYLPFLRHRFWKLTLQIINRYSTFIDECRSKNEEAQILLQKNQLGHKHHQKSGSSLSELTSSSRASSLTRNSHKPPGSRCSNSSREEQDSGVAGILTTDCKLRLLLDVNHLCREARTLVNSKLVTSKLSDEEKEAKLKLMNRALEESLQLLDESVEPVRKEICNQLKEQCSIRVRLVNDVPRQYRKMNRDWPSRASAYVSGMLGPLITFLEENKSLLECKDGEGRRMFDQWAVDCLQEITKMYYSQLSELLISVRKMEESLKKLKRARGTVTAAGSESTTTDDDKIRHQLYLDVQHYRNEISNIFHFEPNSISLMEDLIKVTENAKQLPTSDSLA